MTNLQSIFVSVSKSVGLVLVFVAAASTQASASSEEFGRCLTENGATFYGTSWCPHCRAQRQMLGRAMSGVEYVECSIAGKRDAQRSVCDRAGIQGYPTWVFGDGSRVGGKMSLASLATRTGCKLPTSGATENLDRTDADGVRHRKVGGALIIDIPQ